VKKKIIIFILFILTYGCGYTPIYSNYENKSFKIKISEVSGDNTINDLVEERLKNASNDESQKEYILKIQTNLSESIISRDNKGNPKTLKLASNSRVNVEYKDKTKEFFINQKTNFDIDNDQLDLDNYKKSIKQNFAISTVNELMLLLAIIE
jgi:hypothetical protein